MKILVLLLCLLLPAISHATDNTPASDSTALTDVTVTSTATLVKTSNAARIWLNCTNTDSSVNVRWGNSLVTSTKGQQLQAGSSVQIANRAAIFMASEGADVTVACTEETR